MARTLTQRVSGLGLGFRVYGVLVAEWIHFTLLGIILPTLKLGLMNSATKVLSVSTRVS